MHYIDFHTHSSLTETNTISVKNLLANTTKTIVGEGPFSIGIHPWDTIGYNIDIEFNRFQTLASDSRIIAIGEIGLDKLKAAVPEKQQTILLKQIEMANQLVKPVIIHCVKAWQEIIEARKLKGGKSSWALHGFRGNSLLAASLVNAGFYISFGEALLKSDSKIRAAILSIPLDKLFLETDDSGKKIQDIYQAASENFKYSYRTT